MNKVPLLDPVIIYPEKRCCIFNEQTAADAYRILRCNTLAEYRDRYRDPNGHVQHYLHTWDDGYRSLLQCVKCGALFLVQSSEYHGSESDGYYTDFFPVVSAENAEAINAAYDGFKLERQYKGLKLSITNLHPSWNKEEQ